MKSFIIKSKYGEFTIKYSDEDHEFIISMYWHIQKTNDGLFYVKNRFGYLHRLLMGNPDSYVDHRNRETLDNQRDNLRIVNASQSSLNRRKQRRTNEFRGVDYVKAVDKFRVRVTVDNKVIFGGNYTDKKQAALKYNELATKYHGDFAELNSL